MSVFEENAEDDYKRPFPSVVRIEPASVCNLKCRHCPTGTIEKKRGIMSEKTFNIVLNNIRLALNDIKVVVLYHGGEPLLNKHFFDMVRQVKALGIPFVKTVSNGMLLTDDRIEETIRSGLDAIEISLDGRSPEENDFIRRGCDYSMVIDNIRRLIALKKKLGSKLPRIFISSTQFLKPGSLKPALAPDPPEYLLREFLNEKDEIEFKCVWALEWPQVDLDLDVFTIWRSSVGDGGDRCEHIEKTMTIDWNGDVLSCCYDITSQSVLGNVNGAMLSEIWNGNKYVSLRRSIRLKDYFPLCGRCNVVRPGVYLMFKEH